MDTIIHVGGDPAESMTVAALLAGSYRVVGCDDALSARQAARRSTPAAVIVDLDSCGDDWLPTVAKLSREGCRVIAVSAEADPRTIVRALRAGACDFLRKPNAAAELRASLQGCDPETLAPPSAVFPVPATSPAFRKVVDELRLFARCDFPVLLLGESGTGKDVAARALHELSDRRRRPFVARNCAALPELLAESELFGTEKGAFTDAVARPGAFELARGGVLFLDEIGGSSLSVQAKLLRVLETEELWRLGASKPAQVDVRLVSATSEDLAAAVERGAFRLDLLYRIDTLVLELPPLRERREDIPDLASYFALKASGGRTVPGRAAVEKLAAYSWPGNIRQLRNVVQRAVVLSRGAEELGEEHIRI